MRRGAAPAILPCQGVPALFRDILIGQYYPGNSAIHRLDPRTKIIFTFALVAGLFIATTFTGFFVVGFFVFFAVLFARVPFGLILRSMRPILFLLVLTVTLHALMGGGPDAHVLWTVGPVKITKEGLMTGAFMGLRLGLLIIASSLLTLTTSPIQLTDGMEHLLHPARRIGVPAHELAMMMTIALRFIPTLMEEADKIMKAQLARGADLRSGGLLSRARALIPILVPLFVSAFRRADELALAMEARCYRGGEGRTRYQQLKYGAIDLYAAAIMTVLIAGLVWMRRLGV